MKKLFGEFLCDKGLVTSYVLVDALIKQMKSMPTVIELVYNAGILTPDQVLAAMALQSNEGREFKAACQALGFWNEAAEVVVQRELDQHRVPLGQVLIGTGVLNLAKLSQALEQYLKEYGNDAPLPAAVPAAVPVAVPSPAQVLAEEIAPAVSSSTERADPEPQDLPFKPAFHRVEPGVLQDYCELFNEDRRQEGERLVLTLEAAAVDSSSFLETVRILYREYHTLKGGARFIRAELTEGLLHEAEEILSVLIKMNVSLSSENLERLASISLKVLDTAWELKNVLRQYGTEESYWVSKATNLKYRAIHQALRVFRGKLTLENGDSKK